MKRALIVRISIVFAMLFIGFISCEEELDNRINSVKTLVTPVNNHKVTLDPDGTSILFEWEPVQGSGILLYQIAFDKSDGNFSNPVFVKYSENNGGRSRVSFSQAEMNKIARMMGILSSQSGTFKWTVFALKGLEMMKSQQEFTITVTRMDGFDDLPLSVFLTGAATEAGESIANALTMKGAGPGEFEIYTRLTAGQTYKFVDATSGSPREFSVNNEGKLLEESNLITADKSGIFHIYLNFSTSRTQYREIERVSLFVNGSQEYVDLNYAGKGVWERLNVTPTVSSGDDRYKFRMKASGKETEWRTELPNDSRPPANVQPSYYWMNERFSPDPIQQWTNNEIWKAPWDPIPSAERNWINFPLDIKFILSGSVQNYYHSLEIKR